MKKRSMHLFLLFSLSITLFLSSCSIQKRTHMPGYSIMWNRHKHVAKSAVVSNNTVKIVDSLSEKGLDDNLLKQTETDESITTSTDTNLILLNKKQVFLSSYRDTLDKKTTIISDTITSTPKQMQMNNEKSNQTEEPLKIEDAFKKEKTLLSTLWTFVTLNYLYCDVAGLMDAAILSQYLAGIVGGMVISQGFLLAAGILMEIPISMVLFSRILKGKGNRNANIIAGLIMTAVQIATLFAGPVASYYLFFSIIEIAATAFITWYAWKKLPKKKELPLAN